MTASIAEPIPPLPDVILEPLVRLALTEDLGRGGDITSDAVIPAEAKMTGLVQAREQGVAAGYDAARLAMRLIDPETNWTTHLHEGHQLSPSDKLFSVSGKARSILSAERVMLNFVGPLSGVATLTRKFVDAVEGADAQIVCTRKTRPGFRALEKRAVRIGGGVNHRLGLDDAMLIKDNHIAAAGGVAEAMQRARAAIGHLRFIEIEVDTLDQLDEALKHQPDAILLDNMSPETLREAVGRIDGRAKSEASGGVTLETVRAIAETGVDYISVGALTHSATNLDIGLDYA